jgi:hypothetical protein
MEESVFDRLEYEETDDGFQCYRISVEPIEWTWERTRNLYKMFIPVERKWYKRHDSLVDFLFISQVREEISSPGGFNIMCHQEHKTYSGIISVESNEVLAKINRFGIYVKEHILTSSSGKEAKLRRFLERVATEIFLEEEI